MSKAKQRDEIHARKLAAASKRVREMDAVDGHEDRSIGTLIAALECGLYGTDDGPAYDALAMLRDIQSAIATRGVMNVMSLKDLFIKVDEAGGVVLHEDRVK